MRTEKIYSGKTKEIHRREDGNLLIIFKDDVTGQDGVVDPGANQVMGRISGKGRMSLEITGHFFRLLEEGGIPTHRVSIIPEKNAMVAREATLPGAVPGVSAGGLEFICRLKAYGSFCRRYRKHVSGELQALDYLVEITLKDDERGDPLINDDAIVALGILEREQLARARELTRRAARIIAAELGEKGLDLVDLKVEFGLVDGKVTLIDEVSADSMRVMDRRGEVLSHEELFRRLTGEGRPQ